MKILRYLVLLTLVYPGHCQTLKTCRTDNELATFEPRSATVCGDPQTHFWRYAVSIDNSGTSLIVRDWKSGQPIVAGYVYLSQKVGAVCLPNDPEQCVMVRIHNVCRRKRIPFIEARISLLGTFKER